jgi:hypothetical protein
MFLHIILTNVFRYDLHQTGRDKKGKPKSMETMARQLEGERMDGTGNEAIFSLFFLEHKKKTTPFQFAPHFSPQF